MAKAPPNPWRWPSKPWQHIHIDYAGPFMNKMYLIVMDAHSKWMEVITMASTTSESTINALRYLFSSYGIVEEIVSDNGPQFVSNEFQNFVKRDLTHSFCPISPKFKRRGRTSSAHIQDCYENYEK